MLAAPRPQRGWANAELSRVSLNKKKTPPTHTEVSRIIVGALTGHIWWDSQGDRQTLGVSSGSWEKQT